MGSEDTVDDDANWLAGHFLRALEDLGSKPPTGDLTVFARGKAIPTSQKWLFIGVKKRHLHQPRPRRRNRRGRIWPLPQRFVLYPRRADVVSANLVWCPRLRRDGEHRGKGRHD